MPLARRTAYGAALAECSSASAHREERVMSQLDQTYVELTNDVLAVNYWGELLTVELLSGLLRRDLPAELSRLVSRQLMDETRHANITRAFLIQRDRDPIRDDGVVEFTYHNLFLQWAERSLEETLAFLGSNERSSSRNFGSLIRVGKAANDMPMVAIYSEILNDEASHAHNIFEILKGAPGVEEWSALAHQQMNASFNLRYAKLVMAYPRAFPRRTAKGE